MCSIVAFILLLTTAPFAVETIELLHDTDRLPNVQYYDCLHYTNEFTNTRAIKYCIQPKDIINYTSRNDRIQCEKGAIAHWFSSLFENEIDPSLVLKTFRSGIEQADRYGAYFFHRKLNASSTLIDDDFLCNCSSLKGVFGRYCEYELYIGSTLTETARKIKIKSKTHALAGQLQRRRMCYTSIDCEYGLLCLDWRNICDGTQNCINGVDEENCDKIEMNECDENEFRCRNGLCIPEEYWLDGELDCQDASDELVRSDFETSCPQEKGMECDEHLCQHRFQLPCGDGQCATSYAFNKVIIDSLGEYETSFTCSTLRDLAFLCEINQPFPFWTLKGGFCVWLRHSLGAHMLTTAVDLCEFLLKCLLSLNLSTNCPTNDEVPLLLKILCESRLDLIEYPPGPLMGPLIHTYYNVDHKVTDGLFPDYAIIRGQLRCAGFHLTLLEYGAPISNSEVSLLSLSSYIAGALCSFAMSSESDPSIVRNYSIFAPHYDTSCWHKWLPFYNLSRVEEVAASCNEFCLSPHRIHDGVADCTTNLANPFDEAIKIRSIEHDNKHCLNCITHKQKSACLPLISINSESYICAHGEDIYLAETSIAIKTLKCDDNDASECHIIRSYIMQSSINKENVTIKTSVSSSKVLPFSKHCDTYFDTATGIDEAAEYCLSEWICADNEYRCLTGQCIPFDWLCDGEWDCSDASDEQRLLLQLDDFADEHNRRVQNLTEIWMRCFERYKKQAFANICNITLEYPCLLANVDDPLNLILNRPCVELKRIGDGRVDCLGKFDERNLIKCTSDVLGWQFGCTGTQNICVHPVVLCSFYYGCPVEDVRSACFGKSFSICSRPADAMCLNGTCQRDARCNGKWECDNGEDEYWCHFDSRHVKTDEKPYRGSRRMELQSKMTLTKYFSPFTDHAVRQPSEPSVIDRIEGISNMMNAQKRTRTTDTFPSDDMIIDELLEEIRSDPQTMLLSELPFICNRGIPIKHDNGRTQCLCSPSFYGDYCEFQADRISVITHFNLTKYTAQDTVIHSQNSSILISCTFHSAKRIVDRHEFHVHSTAKDVKQKFYFAYPRTAEFQEKRRKQRNGTQLYSIRFEAFYLQRLFPPTRLAVWHFPIQFDFLPAFRFAKVLHFNNTNQNYSCDLVCGAHGKCSRLENKITQFICSCQSGWFGDQCERDDDQCDSFCHPQALCRPQERGFINNDQRPACLCPHGWFGPTCHLTYLECKQCHHGGSCYLTHDRSHLEPFKCLCTEEFYGDYCQFPKRSVFLRTDRYDSSKILATSIQYYDVSIDLSDLYLNKQQVFLGRPLEIHMDYEQENAPSVILIKSYTEWQSPQGPLFHLIYSEKNLKDSINMSIQLTSENECAHTRTLFDSKVIQSTDAKVLIFKYHDLCRRHRPQNRSSIVCFRDNHYFCLCNMTIQHAQCLTFDPYSDKCQHCLSGGQCIRGSLQQEQDFLCLCPRCMYGSVCQYSGQLFSFTLDSLIIKDIQVRHDLSIGVYISITSLVFLTGIFSNICSLLVFSRQKPRQVGVGNYLLLVSIVNIVSLILLFAKIIHILLGSAGLLMSNMTNLILCKSLSSLLSISIRVNYWFTSLVTIERLSLVLFPTSTTIKKPRTALLLSFATALILCGMHIHEILHYTIIPANPQQINSSAIFCVTNFDHRGWFIYNQINVLIHHLAPFVIQIISITLLIVWAAKSRARIVKTRTNSFSQILKKQFKTQKELYLTPAIIILAALPQIILTSSLACTELSNAWQRYALLVSYLFSFTPQICGFVIYVLPSSSYKTEFINTGIGRRLLRVKKDNSKNIHSHVSRVTKPQGTRL